VKTWEERVLALVHGPPHRVSEQRALSDNNVLIQVDHLRRHSEVPVVQAPIAGPATPAQVRLRAEELARCRYVLEGEIDDLSRFSSGQRILCTGYFTPFKADYRLERFSQEKYGDWLSEDDWSEASFGDLDYTFATCSDYASDVLARSYGIPRERFRVLGYPRHDLLLEERPALDLAELFGLERQPEHLLIYAPTFRDRDVYRLDDPDPLRSEHVFGVAGLERELSALCQRTQTLLLIKLHKYFPRYRELEARLAGPQGRYLPGLHFLTDSLEVAKGISVYDLFRQSRALISDYSSISFDYLFVDRPLVYWAYDQDEYAHYRGFAHDPVEDLMAGPVARTPAALLEALEAVLEGGDPGVSRRAELHAWVHEARDGRARERIQRYLLTPEVSA
jgi:CDP-glycerol glycerophosphotransferase (TagB/SpsB family)